MTSAPLLSSTSPGTVNRRLAAAGRGRRKLSTCRAAVVSSGAPFPAPGGARRRPRQTTPAGPSRRGRSARHDRRAGRPDADAAEVQRQGVQTVLQDVQGKQAVDLGPLRLGGDRIVGRGHEGRQRRVGFGSRWARFTGRCIPGARASPASAGFPTGCAGRRKARRFRGPFAPAAGRLPPTPERGDERDNEGGDHDQCKRVATTRGRRWRSGQPSLRRHGAGGGGVRGRWRSRSFHRSAGTGPAGAEIAIRNLKLKFEILKWRLPTHGSALLRSARPRSAVVAPSSGFAGPGGGSAAGGSARGGSG